MIMPEKRLEMATEILKLIIWYNWADAQKFS